MAYTFPSDAHASGDTGHVIDHNNLVDVLTGMGAVYNVQNTAFAGGAKGDGAADDTAAISAAETAAAAAGGVLIFPPGTYKTTGLVKKSSSTWRGAGRGATIIKLANGANTPILVSDQFAALTLTGSTTGGITSFFIRDMTFDGNASAQSAAAAAAVQIYGCDYLVENVSVRNFLATDGLYTEFAPGGGPGLPDLTMESVFRSLRIHDNTLTGAGWHNRGPHDSNVYGCWIYNNTNSAYGYWPEATFSTYTASGLSGTAVSSTPATITVTTTLNLPTAGSATIPSGGGTVTITWTGTTATTLTGCAHTGGSGNYTSNTLTPSQFSGAACTVYGMHVWGNHNIAVVNDAQTSFVGCQAEGALTGQVLLRSQPGASWTGGRIFNPGGNSANAYGIQYGDATNTCLGFVLASPHITGFAGGAASKAYINVVSEGSGRHEALLTLSSTNQAVYGSFGTSAYHRIIFEAGGSTTPGVAAGASAGTTPPTPTLANADDRCAQVNWGTGTTPAAGSQVVVTYAQPKPRNPAVAIWPLNAATAALQPYVASGSATSFQVNVGVAPAASQSVGTYQVGFADVTG